ncbi:rod shape-determining protein MreD [Sphingomonas solaris]|uniref:Rod shape-determining protein MreD n=1 Tax=Alterirhizorhabdus solaris TaxID=2529389 RepID=A0A558RD73_9SPHN|nr:rod shape-determining protein MreD [Sphingomonas solaris]TVV77326.1 rod shape-determining protein MreD [Sphingomonas solaris]
MIRTAADRTRLLPPRARLVPVASTMAGSLLHALPVVATAPVMPPFGLLVLLGWRLLRPELWHAWVALPLGLFDDLAAGHPPGSAMTLWTFGFLLLDMLDDRLLWRDYWIEWLVAAALIALCMTGTWAVAAFTTGERAIGAILPQIMVTIFCFPAVVRVCAVLDRWRLRR